MSPHSRKFGFEACFLRRFFRQKAPGWTCTTSRFFCLMSNSSIFLYAVSFPIPTLQHWTANRQPKSSNPPRSENISLFIMSMIPVSFPLFVNSSSDANSRSHLCFVKVCLSLARYYPLQLRWCRYIGCGIFSSAKNYIFAHSLLVAALERKCTTLWWPCHYLPRTTYVGKAETLSWSRNFTFGHIRRWQKFLTQIRQSCPHAATPLDLRLSPSSQPLYHFPAAVLTGRSTSRHSAHPLCSCSKSHMLGLQGRLSCLWFVVLVLVCLCTLHHSRCSTLCHVIVLVDTSCSFAVTHCLRAQYPSPKPSSRIVVANLSR